MAETKTIIRRHSTAVRLTHWINAACLAILLMSGLQIFNAHRALYWGLQSDFAQPAFVLPQGFPHALILPGYQDLATGRRWHFFFAWIFLLNGLVYLAIGLAQKHIRRDLLPTRRQLRDIWPSVLEHLRLKFPAGEEARNYNVLQKLAYLAVIFALLPLMLLSGLTMSPGMNAAFPALLDLFGGRQSARTIHFITASLLVLFTIVHVLMVLLSGPVNNMRAMITGRYALPPARAKEHAS
jgi:thiosulfate reductase cytochrome b subunit